MSKENSQIAKAILERAKIFLRFRTDSELAEALKIKANTISTWKNRGLGDLGALERGLELCGFVGLVGGGER